jgi:citrate lyase subunit beta/citryl-CoA lyase
VNRSRRSVLVLPGNNRRMAEKATTLDAAEVVLDPEDAVPNIPAEKEDARRLLVAALEELDFGHRTVSVRINGIQGPHALRDVLALRPVADKISCLVIPKVASPSQVSFVDHLLSGLEAEAGISTPIGLELQIEDPKGLETVSEIAGTSARTEALIFGPGDFAAAMGMPQLQIGQEMAGYPGDIWHYALFRIAVAARARGLQAIDGPVSDIEDITLLERASRRAVQLGYEGKWVIHPTQLDAVNRAFTPGPEQVRRAEEILAALNQRGGASRMGGEMVDEAHGRMAREVLLRAEHPVPD